MHAFICRSGTEEEYDELTQLLEDIFTYRRDVLAALSKEKEEKKKKELCEKKQAEDMRESAMETLSRMFDHLYVSFQCCVFHCVFYM